MEKKGTLLLDVDDVICFSIFLDAVNNFLGTNYEIDDFTDYYIDEAAIPKGKFADFVKYVNSINLYENIKTLPNAVEVIRKLNEVYDVYICSACINPFDIKGSGRMFSDKYNFLINILPFIDPNRFIFTSSKHMFKADVQIDDRLDNLDDDIGIKILFPAYHNKDISDEELNRRGIIRAGNDWRNGWCRIDDILLKSKKQKVYCNKKDH